MRQRHAPCCAGASARTHARTRAPGQAGDVDGFGRRLRAGVSNACSRSPCADSGGSQRAGARAPQTRACAAHHQAGRGPCRGAPDSLRRLFHARPASATERRARQPSQRSVGTPAACRRACSVRRSGPVAPASGSSAGSPARATSHGGCEVAATARRRRARTAQLPGQAVLSACVPKRHACASAPSELGAVMLFFARRARSTRVATPHRRAPPPAPWRATALRALQTTGGAAAASSGALAEEALLWRRKDHAKAAANPAAACCAAPRACPRLSKRLRRAAGQQKKKALLSHFLGLARCAGAHSPSPPALLPACGVAGGDTERASSARPRARVLRPPRALARAPRAARCALSRDGRASRVRQRRGRAGAAERARA